MPGIVGIISRDSAEDCRSSVVSMLASMRYEEFYVSGTYFVPSLGIYAGWVAHEDTSASTQVFFNEQKDIALVLSGECFADVEMQDGLRRKGHRFDGTGNEWLVHLYEEKGDRFFEELNGLFSGLLVDKRSNRAFLFNDRYGAERIYWHDDGDRFYFASEAKALLRVRRQLRAFDREGVAQFLTFGCALENRTLFQGVELLPGGSVWSFERGSLHKRKYFSPEVLESEPLLSTRAFELVLEETFKKVLPRYSESKRGLGISLTGGLDSRMILACLPETKETPVCYTFSGERGETLDDRLAARAARTRGFEHEVLRIGPEFFSDFASYADRTVYVTDGCFGITGAHEIYLNKQARALAPVRLTGNFGSEVLRGISTFNPIRLAPGLINRTLRDGVGRCEAWRTEQTEHPVTFAAFREAPWKLFGSMAAARSQVTFRTPYLDNELVALAYRVSESVRKSPQIAWRLIENNCHGLASIPTDMGFKANDFPFFAALRRLVAKATFKLDYLNNEGLPHRLSSLEALFGPVGVGLGILGLHKYLHYRSWFRRELADYIMGRLADAQTRRSQFWDSDFVRTIGGEHLRGRRNFVNEINTVLTLNAIERLLFRDHIPNFVQDAAFTSENMAGVIGRQTKDSSFAT